MVDWSWALLTEAQQDLLVRLAVVPAPFGPDLAAALGGDARQARMDLAALVEQSLVQLGDDAGGAQYRLLETVREYGEARLDDRGERAETLDRLAAWGADLCRTLAPDLVGPRQVETFADRHARDRDAHHRPALGGRAWRRAPSPSRSPPSCSPCGPPAGCTPRRRAGRRP